MPRSTLGEPYTILPNRNFWYVLLLTTDAVLGQYWLPAAGSRSLRSIPPVLKIGTGMPESQIFWWLFLRLEPMSSSQHDQADSSRTEDGSSLWFSPELPWRLISVLSCRKDRCLYWGEGGGGDNSYILLKNWNSIYSGFFLRAANEI